MMTERENLHISYKPDGVQGFFGLGDNSASSAMRHMHSSDTMSTIISCSSPGSPKSTQSLIMDGSNGSSNIESKKLTSRPTSYKEYPLRWPILFLFVAYSMSNAFQWIQYSIINNIITYYYQVDSTWVNWTSMVYMVAYIPLIFPASWYLEKQGLRKAVLIGSFGTMVGAWIKCGSIHPDRFVVSFVGQIITAVSQLFVLGIPPRLAAVWFGANTVSTACAIGVFGNQLGVALGFLLPPIFVPDSKDVSEISTGLSIMFYTVAGLCTLLFLLIIFVFREAPPTPPSAAAQASMEEQSESYVSGIIRLMRNRNYILLLISYGMNVGVFYGISTLLNQTVLAYFNEDADATKDAGRIGLLIVLAGMVGSVVCGLILDRTAKFKLVTVGIYVFSFGFMIVYTFIFDLRILALVYITAGTLGFFMTGYLPVGFEFAAELTFPEPEGTSSGLLNASAQFFGMLCTIAGGELIKYSERAVNLVFCAVLLVGSIMTILIREDLKRQAARRQDAHKNISEPQE